ncbi:MAG: type II toxin-antitoxin system VapC family toxin [Solirubrobacteraceae bacterium]
MILVDTSLWIDHLRSGNDVLADLLDNSAVLAHPWVTGELALGNLTHRAEILALLRALPQATLAEHDEVLLLIEQQALSGAGIGYVDAQLLAASRLTPDTKLWTTDKRLANIAARLGLEYQPAEQR